MPAELTNPMLPGFYVDLSDVFEMLLDEATQSALMLAQKERARKSLLEGIRRGYAASEIVLAQHLRQ